VEPWTRAGWLQRQVQRRLRRGPIISEINRRVLDAARAMKPDLVWAEKQEFLREETIEAMRGLGARLAHFTPDPYFALDWKRTALMDRAMGAFDVLVYCKAYERADYEALGKQLVYMPLGYCDEVHRPLPSADPSWRSTVGFLGGWEPRRERLLHDVAQLGIDLKVWGENWDFLADGRWSPRRYAVLRQLAGEDGFRIHRDPLLASAHRGREVYADDYARALSGAEIGLGFLRKVCPDQHTTRTFEIPACGSMLLADRTDEHRAFFEEGEEADFFGSRDELLDKLRFYTSHAEVRQSVAAAGRERCVRGQYAYVHRVKAALLEIGAAVAA
ncbi:MAG: CgeB family protein, partial [Caulobacteraceae bacterium]